MNTEEQLTKILNELEDIIDVQVYSHEVRDDLLAAEQAVYRARDTVHRVITLGQPDRYGKTIGSARKQIKSSLEDRLVPYLEEFEEGFADTQVVAPGDEMDIPSRQETFFEIFKNDYNLSDEDINKLKDAVMDIWEASAGN